MTDPYLVPCLVVLRSEFNELSPGRDKGSDGWIGDAAHQREKSDHNPDAQGRVLAIDVDSTGPWPVPFPDLVESLRGDDRLEYMIFNHRIASRNHAGWAWRPYGGSDPHTGHAHFSARHDHTGNTSTASWPVGDFMTSIDDLIRNTSKDDRIPETVLGHFALSQGIPDGTLDGERVAAWQAIEHLGKALVQLQADVAAIRAKVGA